MIRTFYFAYGSNMRSSRLIERVGSVSLYGVAILSDFRHRFNKHGSDGTAKGNIEASVGAVVHGVVYQLTHRQFEILDRYEGGYEPIELAVESNGETVECASYGAVLRRDGLKPTERYLLHYVEGAFEHGLPSSYIDSILPSWFEKKGS